MVVEVNHPQEGSPIVAVDRAAMGRRARIMRAVNVPMRAVLGLPFATPLSGNLMLISYTGRKSGKAYRQPVSYVRDGDVLLTPGGGRWTLNLTDGRPVEIRLRGRNVPARPELVTDHAELERLLGVIAEKNPRAARFIPIRAGLMGVWTPTPSMPRCGTGSASCAGTSWSRGRGLGRGEAGPVAPAPSWPCFAGERHRRAGIRRRCTPTRTCAGHAPRPVLINKKIFGSDGATPHEVRGPLPPSSGGKGPRTPSAAPIEREACVNTRLLGPGGHVCQAPARFDWGACVTSPIYRGRGDTRPDPAGSAGGELLLERIGIGGDGLVRGRAGGAADD